MGLFGRKFNHFKDCGYFIQVQFTNSARQWLLGGDENKRINHYQNGNLVQVETYNPIKIKSYKRDGILVVDRTIGMEIPKDAVEMPVIEQAMGTIEMSRRIH